MDVSIPQLHLRARYAMDGSEKDVEFQKASRAVSLQTKAAIFGLKLVTATQQSPVTQFFSYTSGQNYSVL